jgi:hypothetical protein
MESLHVIHDLNCAVCNAKPDAVDQKLQHDKQIQDKDWRPIPLAHEFWRQQSAIGTGLSGPVHPRVRQAWEDENGW